jgi:hypothetical protein
MSNREQIEKPGQKDQEKPAEVAEPKDLSNKDLAKSTEDVIDEIDNLLEEVLGEGTALDFVTNYLQKGGQAIFLSLSSGTILKMLGVL